MHDPQLIVVPQPLSPDPHAQSTPQTDGLQQAPLAQVWPEPHAQSAGHDEQFSLWETQMPSPQVATQAPDEQVRPLPQLPQLPPQPSSPQVLPEQLGVQHAF